VAIPDLDRMAIDDVAATPQAIAAEIHRQLGAIPSPIPVREIALALDIVEIRHEPLAGVEGSLITDAERSSGDILLNSRSGRSRQRYSLAHELGHFLCQWHRQIGEGGFYCTREDMAAWVGRGRHGQQESEANRFAIELLAPARFFVPYCKRLPDLQHVLDLSQALEVSKAATARRYISLHRDCLAVAFARDGRLFYADCSDDFPRIALKSGERLPLLPDTNHSSPLSDVVEADAEAWLDRRINGELATQVLAQEGGHAIVLLSFSADERDDPGR
jgi:hypothetical protein